MINIAALDPSSLALWFEPRLLAQRRDGHFLQEVIISAVLGIGQDDIKKRIKSNQEEFAGYVLSTVWHENRHFHDLLLTNYGFARIWQFFSIYANAREFLRAVHLNGGKITFPLEIYLDDFRREVCGISDFPDVLQVLARDIKRRQNYFETDNSFFPSPFGTFAFGGHAQLEALALYYQVQGVFHQFGQKMADYVSIQVNKSDPDRARYLWPLWLGNIFNLEATKLSDTMIKVDYASMPPILIAALATQTVGKVEFRLPASRLMMMGEYIEQHPGAIEQRNWFKTWNNINEICLALFGKTVLEELEEDFKIRQNSIAKWRASGEGVTFPSVISCAEQLLKARRFLLDFLTKNPEYIFDPEIVGNVTLGHNFALPVAFFPDGIDNLPPGWKQIIGYKGEDRSWVWAATPEPENWPPEGLAFPDPRPWYDIIDFLAPLAKLMMRGKRHRTAIGPELHLAESKLKYDFNFDVNFEPLFSNPPEETMPGNVVFDLLDSEEEMCDVCQASIKANDGTLVSPWNYRVRAAKYGSFEGDTLILTEADLDKGKRDWSPILVCRPCCERFERFGFLETNRANSG